MQYFCNKEISGGIAIINNLVTEVLSDIEPIILDEDIFFDIRLILNELLINCHEHGNKSDCKKKIRLEMKIDNDIVQIKVADEGKGVFKRNMYDVSECKETGRGLMLVEALSDKVSYENNIVKCSIMMTP